MRKLLFVLVLLSLVLLPVGVASATTPTDATGDLTIQNTSVTILKVADGNTFVAITSIATATGDIAGTMTFDQSAVIHPDGHATIQFTGTCDPCTILGRDGTITFRGSSVQDYPGGPSNGTILITGGTGDLWNLQGEGTFAATWNGPVASGTYEMKLHFDP